MFRQGPIYHVSLIFQLWYPELLVQSWHSKDQKPSRGEKPKSCCDFISIAFVFCFCICSLPNSIRPKISSYKDPASANSNCLQLVEALKSEYNTLKTTLYGKLTHKVKWRIDLQCALIGLSIQWTFNEFQHHAKF